MACLLPLGMQAQQGTFRFAQLTDIHLTPNNPNPTEDLLRSVAQINVILLLILPAICMLITAVPLIWTWIIILKL